MLFVLSQEIRNIDEGIGLDRLGDGGEERGIESADGSVILECDLIRVARRIRFRCPGR
jgi:hypothetical protein